MPRGDRTGPQGQGPKTGRGLGPYGTGTEEAVNPGERIGFFQRLGRGLGLGRKEQAEVKVDPAEVGTGKAAHFSTISIRRYVSCQVEIEQAPQEWDQ